MIKELERVRVFWWIYDSSKEMAINELVSLEQV